MLRLPELTRLQPSDKFFGHRPSHRRRPGPGPVPREQLGHPATLHLVAIVENTLPAHPGDFRDLLGRQLMLRDQPHHQKSLPRPVRLRPLPRRFDFLHQFFSERR